MMVPRFLQDICYNKMAFSVKVINKFAAVYLCGTKHKRNISQTETTCINFLTSITYTMMMLMYLNTVLSKCEAHLFNSRCYLGGSLHRQGDF